MTLSLKSLLGVLLLCHLTGWGYARVFPSPAIDWYDQGEAFLKKVVNEKPNEGVAKNVILMIGDGMGISTVTASRIYEGQKRGESGEENNLSFETLPNVALSKTYALNGQVTDSASSATAMMAGAKANLAVLGVGPNVIFGDCASMKGEKRASILELSQQQGKSTGFITTTTLTHATVAAAYAHSPSRFWESNENIPPEEFNSGMCRDIAYQLVYDNTDINVMLAGGRRQFLPNTTRDPEYPEIMGLRTDGRDLFQVWQNAQAEKGRSHNFVWNKAQFDAVNPETTDYLLGSFEPGLLKLMAERDENESEPTLTEMVEKALTILSKNENGYFLLIEGGTIDYGHHFGSAYKAMEETLEFSRAAQKVMDLTSEEDTLLVVTADHSHTLTISGYPIRGNDILATVASAPGFEKYSTPTDDMPYTTLGYQNGRGTGGRRNLTGIDTTSKNFTQGFHVPLLIETHTGEDVGIYSRGPMSHLFRSTQENTFMFHIMAYASCVGPNKEHCEQKPTATLISPEECPQINKNGGELFIISTATILFFSSVVLNELVYL